MECRKEPHYQISEWQVTGPTEVGQPVQTLSAVCLLCGMRTAIRTVIAVEN